MVLAAGIVFQLPILVYFLSKVGLVTPDFLKRYRRHALILIVTLSAIITPPDIFSQVLVALPLMILYEIGIGISRRIMREQEAEFSSDDKKGDKKSDKGVKSEKGVKGDKDVKDDKKRLMKDVKVTRRVKDVKDDKKSGKDVKDDKDDRRIIQMNVRSDKKS